MRLSYTLNDLEEFTMNAKNIQDDMLEQILRVNANTEYLQCFLNGSIRKEVFKKNVPVVNYEDVKPYIERVANGEPSNVITGEPITNFFQRHINGAEDGKMIAFISTRSLSKTPSGLPVAAVITSLVKSNYFKNRSSKCFTSPDEVIYCSDNKQNIYCHLLCALVQREEAVSVFAYFSFTIVQAITFLETHWKELCSNIQSGHVSEWITDISCRDSVSAILGGPNHELADLIEYECKKKSWKVIITRLWPNIKFIQSTVTGQMSQYIPILEFYSNKLPLISPSYASSETFFGINVNPLCKPQDVSYTVMPNMSYFEFQDKGNNDEIVDLVDVKLGCFYEPLVTNHYGLYRYRMGDILQVTGFYNKAPQFRFIRRSNVVLNVETEATTEQDLLKALDQATLLLESSDIMLIGFTSYADVSTFPGHYVFYWELKAKEVNNVAELDNKLMLECCCIMEESFNGTYRCYRSKLGTVGALEVRIVQQGTFESLMEYFISHGASTSQYKTPMCISSLQALEVLEEKVLARFFSNKSPPL